MKRAKTIFFLLVVIITVLVISACGVSQEEYDRTITELARTKVELEEARSKIAEMEKSVALPATNADIVEKLRAAQQKAADLSAKVRDLTIKNEQLIKDLAEMKAGIKE